MYKMNLQCMRALHLLLSNGTQDNYDFFCSDLVRQVGLNIQIVSLVVSRSILLRGRSTIYLFFLKRKMRIFFSE